LREKAGIIIAPFSEAVSHLCGRWFIITANPRLLNGTHHWPMPQRLLPADGGLLFFARRLIIYVRDHHHHWALEASIGAAGRGLEKYRL
jgi:hypothetical protein